MLSFFLLMFNASCRNSQNRNEMKGPLTIIPKEVKKKEGECLMFHPLNKIYFVLDPPTH